MFAISCRKRCCWLHSVVPRSTDASPSNPTGQPVYVVHRFSPSLTACCRGCTDENEGSQS